MRLPFRKASGPAPVAAHPPVERKGFDPDIPEGGTTADQQSATSAVSRKEDIDDLFAAYIGCPPASTGVDAIARTITAGGLALEPETEDHEKLAKVPAQLPAQVQAVQDLIDFCNPDHDIRQLMRNVIVDLLVTGDAFVEVTWAYGVPIALWNLDSATTSPIADTHGAISKYVQQVGPGRVAEFSPNEVIHIKLDAPRGGVFGLSPIRKLMPTVLTYIWTESLLKETMKKGNPPRLHLKFPVTEDAKAIKIFRQQYPVRHMGPANLGTPLTTKGADAQEFKASAIAEYLSTLDHQRDVILSGLGVPGRKVGVAEPGSLGGQGAELGQDRTFRLNTCNPYGELVLEKFNFVILAAFGVKGYKLHFGQIDERDEYQLEQMRDMRLRNGAWSLNRYRADIDEPPVDGGDVAVLVDRQNLVAWSDLPALSKANVQSAQNAANGDGGDIPPTAGQQAGQGQQAGPGGTKPGAKGNQGAKTAPKSPKAPQGAKASESDEDDWAAEYDARRQRVLAAVRAQLEAA